MPSGVPTLGDPKRREALSQPNPAPEILGTVKEPLTDLTPKREGSMWNAEDGTLMDYQEAPPPWEIRGEADNSDARKYVRVPDDWVLRWINPKLLDSEGWRGWMPIKASDRRVTPLVRTMVTVDNYVRRGGPTGDFLAWMPQHWVESRRRIRQEKTDRQTASAQRKQEELAEEVKRGTFGPYLKFEHAIHPTHTQGEGRTMKD